MLGWYVGLYRLADGGDGPAEADSLRGQCIAKWLAGSSRLKQYDDMAEDGRALSYLANGFPDRYTMKAKDILPDMRTNGPYNRMGAQTLDEFLKHPPGPVTQPGFDAAVADACHPDEWLLIEAWDGG